MGCTLSKFLLLCCTIQPDRTVHKDCELRVLGYVTEGTEGGGGEEVRRG